jgi:adenylate cyclase
MDDVAALYRKVGLDEPRYTREDLADLTGIDRARSVKWWRAMGLPEVPSGVRAFGDDDLQVVQRLAALTGSGRADDEIVMRLARLLGVTCSRIAEAQVETLEQQTGQRLTDIDPAIVDLMTDSIVYVWRRHLLAALGRRIDMPDAGNDLAVGFADLSDYTRRTSELDPEQLTQLIDRFEEIAFDVVSACEGRVVKLVGDEVMFVADAMAAAVDIGLTLIERLADVPDMPPVHCGVASGPTVSVGGDVFGPAVNLAARLRDIARPGSVIVPADVDLDGLDVTRVRHTFRLKGIGETRVAVVRRPA